MSSRTKRMVTRMTITQSCGGGSAGGVGKRYLTAKMPNKTAPVIVKDG